MTGGRDARFVYRYGSATDDALTPRPKDLAATPGADPGLSVDFNPPPPGQKAQRLDLSRLDGTGLGYFPDDPAAGGKQGHGVIAPVNDAGKLDLVLLQEWSDTRGSGSRHKFTEAVANAIIVQDIRAKDA